MTAKGFEKSSEALKDIKSNKYKLIYASAEQALSSEFLSLRKDDSSELKKSLSPNFQGTFWANTGRLLRILRDFYSDILSNQLG